MVLSTINPLFLDSTKPVGDKVVTNVELFNVSLQGGEALYFEVTDEFGFVQRFALKTVTTKKSVRHTAEVWLKYQHQIQYRFLIVSEGVETLTTAFRETRAGHVISEKWEPCAEPPAVPKPKKRPSRKAESEKEPRPSREAKANGGKSLCQPQFFDQLKLLIDDLL